MKVRTDFHQHLTTSKEDLSKFAREAVRIARKRLEAGGILGIINGQDQEKGRYETFISGLDRQTLVDIGNAVHVLEEDIYVVKGQEVFTQDGHLLVIGLDEGVKIHDYRPRNVTFEDARKYNGIIGIDHGLFLDGIFRKLIQKGATDLDSLLEGIIPEELIEDMKYLDFLEVHNGEAWIPYPIGLTFRYNSSNRYMQLLFDAIMHKYDIGAISSGDGHSKKREIGLSYTLLEKPDFSSPDKLRTTLRQSIREHKDCKGDRKVNAILPTLNHAFKIGILRLASSFGLYRRIN